MSGVRGYVKYVARGAKAHWLAAVMQVLDEYRDEWPLTIRQLFYRIVATFDYPKTENAYNGLVTLVARARRSHLVNGGHGIPFAAIRDGGLSQSIEPQQFDSEPDFIAAIQHAAETFRLDRQARQDHRVELWCEAGGMVPILQRVGDIYGARVSTGGGYDSLTLRHQLASRVVKRAQEGTATVICHVGDFDPSGENMCDVLREDVGTMVYQRTEEDFGSWFKVKRIALTEQQVIDYDVITAPPKPSDSRMAGFIARHRRLVTHLGSTEIAAQLEALTPSQLRALLTEAIEAELDMQVYAEVVEDEGEIRTRLVEKLA